MGQKLSFAEIRIHLLSSDETLAMHAIQQLKDQGKSTSIPLLLETLARTELSAVKNEVHEMLMAMRVKNAEEELVQGLFNKEISSVHVQILQYLWSNGFSGAGQLHVLVETALKSGLQGMLELLSILEVEYGVYSEEEQLGALSLLRATDQSKFSREEKILFTDILRAIDSLIISE